MTTTKDTSRVLQNPYETVKQQYSEIAAERDRARDKINGLLAGFTFLMFVGLTFVAPFWWRRSRLFNHTIASFKVRNALVKVSLVSECHQLTNGIHL